jgi:sec-independent protein translocase protein TatC
MSADGGGVASEARATAGATLAAVRAELRVAFVVFLAALLATIYALQVFIWTELKAMTTRQLPPDVAARTDIIAVTPFDVILLQAKIGIIVGLLCAVPVLLYRSREALRERDLLPDTPVDRTGLLAIACCSVALFVSGLAYGVLLFFPFMFEFLAGNAVSAGIEPRYSIVEWTQFIAFLSLSFGLAAQLPLAMGALAYTGIVPYEAFRDKWRHAVVGIFAFGAVFSPPDPFTQIMWAAPLIGLYGASLSLTRLVTATRRASVDFSPRAVVRGRWIAITAAAAGGGVSWYVLASGAIALAAGPTVTTTPGALRAPPDPVITTAAGVGGALLAGGLAALFVLVRAVWALDTTGERPLAPTAPDAGDPADIDLAALDAAGVRAAPPEAFAALDEDAAAERARAAMDRDDPEAARAILDRFDTVQAAEDAAGDAAQDDDGSDTGAAGSATADAAPGESTDGVGGALGDTASGVFGAFTDDETEQELGGYPYDLAFVIDSLASRTFRIVAVFMAVLAGTFLWLYAGGLGAVKRSFLANVPAEVRPEEFDIIALHPVEALLFEVKVSVILAVLATIPLVLYYAWPALRERGLADGRRSAILTWGWGMLLGLVVGSALGFTVVAPAIISYLVADAANAGLVVSYRLSNFFWLVFLTTVGVGLLLDVPILMLLLNRAGIVPYRSFRRRWREVVVGITVVLAFATPGGVLQLLVLAIPLSIAYLVGVGCVWIASLGGRRDGPGPVERLRESVG